MDSQGWASSEKKGGEGWEKWAFVEYFNAERIGEPGTR
jgi:hypothetical protein